MLSSRGSLRAIRRRVYGIVFVQHRSVPSDAYYLYMRIVSHRATVYVVVVVGDPFVVRDTRGCALLLVLLMWILCARTSNALSICFSLHRRRSIEWGKYAANDSSRVYRNDNLVCKWELECVRTMSAALRSVWLRLRSYITVCLRQTRTKVH